MGRASCPHTLRCVWWVSALAEAHLWYLELKCFADTKVKFIWGQRLKLILMQPKRGNWLI